MSSLARRLQIRIWKKQNKKPNNHNAVHGGLKQVAVPNTNPVLYIEVPEFQWPLLAANFNKDEEQQAAEEEHRKQLLALKAIEKNDGYRTETGSAST